MYIASWQVVVHLEGNASAISQFDQQQMFSVFPNASSTQLNIVTEVQDFSIAIFDIAGRQSYQGANMKTIEIGSFERGIYIICLEYGNCIFTQKVLKK